MSSSFTEFRGKGFWCHDPLLETWLRVLSLNMDDEAHAPGWQHDLRDKWLSVSAGYCMGWVSASLGDFLTDSDRIDAILRASERSIQHFREFGAFVPYAFFNAVGSEPAPRGRAVRPNREEISARSSRLSPTIAGRSPRDRLAVSGRLCSNEKARRGCSPAGWLAVTRSGLRRHPRTAAIMEDWGMARTPKIPKLRLSLRLWLP